MTHETTARRLVAELVGTALLVAAVVGSGIMAERLAGGNVAIALLANTVATGAALVALILMLAPVSGAHFNPVVSMSAALNSDLPASMAIGYVGVQVVGGLVGAVLANVMFDLQAVELSTKVRTGAGQWIGEFVATFGLVGVIVGTSRRHDLISVALSVAAFITAGYWFTSSTSFANPAVTIARGITNTFTGIRPADAPAFILVQILGAAAATFLFGWLVPRKS
jgi:glycerol uptake facilitator-like aquaporin